MIKIFVEQISERLIYTLDFVFNERGLSYELTNDPDSFKAYNGSKFNYSERFIDDVLQVQPATVLFDEEVLIYEVHSGRFEAADCLTFNRVIDPLASIFYVLSRMEEYTSTVEDEHGRFPAKASVLSRYGWLNHAVCDRWAVEFLRFLAKREVLKFRNYSGEAQIFPTFDIDNVSAYQWKDGIRKWMSTARDFLKGDKIRLNERSQVLKGARIDPYDTFDLILSIADRGYSVTVFWLLGDYAKYDRNVSFRDLRHQRLIRKVSIKTTIGIHPSYKSNSYEYQISAEKKRLEEILNKEVNHSRQHFLKMKLPQTYRALISSGILNDYTMGYAELTGFRAGTARSIYWFDLQKNEKTDLLLHPFVYMDGTLNEYLQLSIPQSKEKIRELYREVKKFGGDFRFIWHNETIGDYGHWAGWKDVLEYSLTLGKEHE
jgi:hypothetical protein